MTDEEIVELYWQRSEEAEECASETYLSAWNQMPSDRPARLLPYLGRIVRCLALDRYDYLKAQKRRTNSPEICLSADTGILIR